MSTKQNKLYEGMFIVNATLSEDARNRALDRIKNAITERGGEIHKIHDQGRKKLAYEINKSREGYYYLVYFSVEPQHMSEIWREYLLNEDLLRYMTLKTDEVKEKLEFKQLVIEA